MTSELSYIIKLMGEAAVQVEFGSVISPQIHKQVKGLADYLEAHPFVGFIEYIASYTGLTVIYNPYLVSKAANLRGSNCVFKYVKELLGNYIVQAEQLPAARPDVVEIPVCYGGEYGPDLEYVAAVNNLTQQEVVAIHSDTEYLVYMIGFCPGFPFLGGMDERIATPRRKSPRLAIPARSIGIAGLQTGGYPISTPGGWNLIGRSAIEMFDINNTSQPSLLKAGDLVHFKPVSPAEYKILRGDEA